MIRLRAKDNIATTLTDALNFIKTAYIVLDYDPHNNEGKKALLQSLAHFGTANLRYCYNQMNKYVCREDVTEMPEAEAKVALFTGRKELLFESMEHIRISVIAAVDNNRLPSSDKEEQHFGEMMIRTAADKLKNLIEYIEGPKY